LIAFPIDLVLRSDGRRDLPVEQLGHVLKQVSGFSGSSLAAEAIARLEQRRTAALLCSHRPAEQDRIASFAKATNVKQADASSWRFPFQDKWPSTKKPAGLAGGL
jgi:hypothetical protein